jgi:hypothetical protein
VRAFVGDYDNDGFAFTPAFANIIVGQEVYDHSTWQESERFLEFVQLCCDCYIVVRENAHDIINAISIMLVADIGEEDDGDGGTLKLNEGALEQIRDRLSLDVEDEVASNNFRRKIMTALDKCGSLEFNWLLNTIGQAL